MTIVVEPGVGRGPGLLDHPKGLAPLIIAELWERFGFYGMRSLLVLYLIDRIGMHAADATTLYGAFAAMAFGISIPGGLLADKIFGTDRLAVIGAVVIILGHGLMVAQDIIGGAVAANFLLPAALAMVATGTGLFKPSISARVGGLYAKGDNRRETGFYFFYVGINVGAALAPLLCGYIGQTYGWRYGFAIAACAMVVGLFALRLAGQSTRADDIPIPPARLWLATFTVPPALAASVFLLLRSPDLVGWLLAVLLIAGLGGLLRLGIQSADHDERMRLLAAVGLILAAAIFWSLHEQGGSTLNVLAAKAVDLRIGGITLRPAQTQFFNALFILIGAPLFALLWKFLRARRAEPAAPYKFAWGLTLAAAAFGLLAIGTSEASIGAKLPLAWLALAYMLETMGELCLATPGYATMSRLAPGNASGLVMGLWLFSLSAGNYIGGKIAAAALAGDADPAHLSTYSGTFAHVALYGAGAAFLLLLMGPRLKAIVATAR